MQANDPNPEKKEATKSAADPVADNIAKDETLAVAEEDKEEGDMNNGKLGGNFEKSDQ